jgi:hypothetical protein
VFGQRVHDDIVCKIVRIVYSQKRFERQRGRSNDWRIRMTLTFERNPFHVKQEFCFTSGDYFEPAMQVPACRHFVQLSTRRHQAIERRRHSRAKLTLPVFLVRATCHYDS